MKTRLLASAVGLLCLLGLGIGAIGAQDKVYRFKRLDVDLTVQTSGDIAVVEVQEYEFLLGTFTFGFRDLPTDKLERVSDVSVSEVGNPYTRVEVASTSSGPPNSFTTFTNDQNEFEVRWFYPSTSKGSRTFTLGYTVQGGLRYHDQADLLWWKAVFPQHYVTLGSSTVTVHLPPGLAADQLTVDSIGAPATQQIIDGQTVVFNASNIPDGQTLDVRVQFPHGIVKGTKPAWQVRDEQWELIAFVFVPIGVALLYFGLLGAYLFWFFARREAPLPLAVTFLSEPPDDLPPGAMGTLIDEQADIRDVLATLLDLLRRGYVRFRTDNPAQAPNGHGSAAPMFERTEMDAKPLRMYEQTLLASLFTSGKQRDYPDLHAQFYVSAPTIETQLYAEVARLGYFHDNPEKTRRTWTWVGIVFTALATIGGLLFAGWSWLTFGYLSLAAYIPIASGVLVGAALMITARQIPARTRQGAAAAAKWQAFRRYLRNIDQFVKAGETSAADIFDQYLPYAVAFGFDSEFANQFSALGTPAPAYLQSAIPHLNQARVNVQDVSQVMHLLDDLPRPALAESLSTPPRSTSTNNLPSLQQTSDGMSASLQAVSNNMSGTLNRSAAAFTTQAAPSIDGAQVAMGTLRVAFILLSLLSGGRGGGGGGGGGGGVG